MFSCAMRFRRRNFPEKPLHRENVLSQTSFIHMIISDSLFSYYAHYHSIVYVSFLFQKPSPHVHTRKRLANQIRKAPFIHTYVYIIIFTINEHNMMYDCVHTTIIICIWH